MAVSRVSVIIPNRNGQQHLERCLSSVVAQDGVDFEVVVVDDASTDDSVALIREKFPQVRVLENAENRGFAAVNNQAIRATGGEYVATLNNDTQVEPGWLREMVGVADGDPRVGMCAPLILLDRQPAAVDSAGLEVDWAGIAWQRARGEPDPGDGEPVEVFGPSAAAALYRRAMLEQIGLFDESFFAYYEDVDLAWRARLAGWKCMYVPSARVRHVHSASFGAQPGRKAYLLARNKWWTIAKNYPRPAMWLAWPLILLYDAASLVRAMIGGQGKAAWRGRWDAWRGMSRVANERRALPAHRSGTSPMLSWPRLRPS